MLPFFLLLYAILYAIETAANEAVAHYRERYYRKAENMLFISKLSGNCWPQSKPPWETRAHCVWILFTAKHSNTQPIPIDSLSAAIFRWNL